MQGKNQWAGHGLETEEDVESKVPRRAEPVSPVTRTGDRSNAPAEAMSRQVQQSHSKKNDGMLDRSLQAQIGRQLRAIYSDIANEDVPDRFVRLLEALEAKEKRA
jgi:hypothetical protein